MVRPVQGGHPAPCQDIPDLFEYIRGLRFVGGGSAGQTAVLVDANDAEIQRIGGPDWSPAVIHATERSTGHSPLLHIRRRRRHDMAGPPDGSGVRGNARNAQRIVITILFVIGTHVSD